MNQPWNDEQARRDAEFYVDAREELAYDKFLTPEGVAALEYKAHEEGHSAGYSEIYNELIDLADFVENIIKHVKR